MADNNKPQDPARKPGESFADYAARLGVEVETGGGSTAVFLSKTASDAAKKQAGK